MMRLREREKAALRYMMENGGQMPASDIRVGLDLTVGEISSIIRRLNEAGLIKPAGIEGASKVWRLA